MLRSLSIPEGLRTFIASSIAFGLAACAGPEVVDDPVAMGKVREAIARVEPKVLELLGTRTPDYEVHLTTEDRWHGAAFTELPSRSIYIRPSAFRDERLDGVLAHELVHVHAVGVWDALPAALDQGLAFYIQHLISGGDPHYEGPTPDLTKLVVALQMSDEEYWSLHGDEDVERGAMWLVWTLGVDGTRRLADLLAQGVDHPDFHAGSSTR